MAKLYFFYQNFPFNFVRKRILEFFILDMLNAILVGFGCNGLKLQK